MQGLSVKPVSVSGLRGKQATITTCRPALTVLPGKPCYSQLAVKFGFRMFQRTRKSVVKAIIEDVKEKKMNAAELEEEFDDLDADLDDSFDLDIDSGLDDDFEEMQDESKVETKSSKPSSAEKDTQQKKGTQQKKEGSKKGVLDTKTIKVDANQTPDESLKLENIGLSPVTVKALAKKKIYSLFPIQKEVFQPAMDGKDMICRAKTGSGKTLAFSLPVVESLIQEEDVKQKTRGRYPRCLVLTPTRELAKQVEEEFQSAAPQLDMGVFYGGTSIQNQQRILRKGTDVVVGTPGRIIDLIERGDLRLQNIRHFILDEADMMLDMGFQEDVERIAVELPTENRQTLLFSATLPSWVKKITKKYQKNPILVDLVGEENTGKIADTIKPLGIQVDWKLKRNLLVDLLSVYGANGKSIVFTMTKREADEVTAGIGQSISSEALHGDITQFQREKTLQKFREGKFQALIATDVAARGLDIPNVDLVVHYDIPQNPESYLHRSGRTGRAGKTGTTITMFSPRDKDLFFRIMQDTKTKVEIIGPPLPQDTMKAAALNVYKKMASVNADVSQFFLPAATQMLEKGDPNKVLASALAALSGFREVPQPKSVLTYEEGLITLIAIDSKKQLNQPNVLLRFLREEAGQHICDAVGRIQVVDDPKSNVQGVAFDLPMDLYEEAVKACENSKSRWKGIKLEPLKVLPVDFSRGRGGRGSRDGYRSNGQWGSRDRGGRGGRWDDRRDFGRNRWEGRGRRNSDRDDWSDRGGRMGGRRDKDDYDDFGGGRRGDRRGGRGDRRGGNDYDDHEGFGGGKSRGGGRRGGDGGGRRGGRKGGDSYESFDDQFDMMGF
eukprot:TRINITY_DN1315_c0_g1_i1.p1 TRINITY_DN1315_c0_g1~~TRINITY_DN1315_c0_g1_i1.p1  ORF type:complete len:861 (-),score=132.40 TRINITY_DN1315_c0_g1_i1:515-3025(-)